MNPCKQANSFRLALLTILLMALSPLHAKAASQLTQVMSGNKSGSWRQTQINRFVRPALADDGTVVTVGGDRLIIGDGGLLRFVDVTAAGLSLRYTAGPMVQVRSAGDIIFYARNAQDDECPDAFSQTGLSYGVHRTSTSRDPITTLDSTCEKDQYDVGIMKQNIAMSSDGMIAYSTINMSRGYTNYVPVSYDPVSGVPRLGEAFRGSPDWILNQGGLDVNGTGVVVGSMEYRDGPNGPYLRGIFVSTPGTSDYIVLDQLNIGNSPEVAINSVGKIAFSIKKFNKNDTSGNSQEFESGIYLADPSDNYETLTLIAGTKAGVYCGFGDVDINDNDDVVFEARLCTEQNTALWSGLYSGPDPSADTIVNYGDPALGSHQFFDSVRLGEINNLGRVSLLTTKQTFFVSTIKVWRWAPLFPIIIDIDPRPRIIINNSCPWYKILGC